MGGAHYIYPCLFGCDDSCDRLGHYLIRPMMFSLCKFMHRDLSIHPTDRWGLNSPDKATIIHMCCVFSAYHATAAHVKQNHDTYGIANQSQKLLIQSQRRTWSTLAEAYEAEARDFGISNRGILSLQSYNGTLIMYWVHKAITGTIGNTNTQYFF